MAEYHNPYHFVPVKKDSRIDDLSREDFSLSPEHVTHDRYYPGTFAGRIVCRLTTESPIFIGAQQKRAPSLEMPGEIEPFELDKKPAIPASTLRGLISSITEAASNSALRVLEEEPYSYRQTMAESLSAIGIVVIEPSENGELLEDEHGNPIFRLRPLTLPTIVTQPGEPAKLPDAFKGMYTVPNLKVYIGTKGSIRHPDFSYETFSHDRECYYGLKLRKRTWDLRNDQLELPFDELQHYKKTYLLAQRPLVAEEPRPWDDIPEVERGDYARGILRILGCDNRPDIPETKKHEIFIPYPEEAAHWSTFEILPEAIERFYDLADLRTEASDESGLCPWPYGPKGTKRNADPDNRNFRLKAGDLVYFQPTGAGKIGKISLSSIWRDRVEVTSGNKRLRATTYNFFKAIDPELLPFNRERKVLTMAEQMFGFVETAQSEGATTLCLAGRLYFSDAHFQGLKEAGSNECSPENGGMVTPYLPSVTLKILNSPKPPSPALYFKESRGESRYIAKKNLAPGRHYPQGRKFYLHHRKQEIKPGGEPWRSISQANTTQHTLEECRFKQKSEITPLKEGAIFYFHVDFYNLSERELGVLLYSLKPTSDFRHKIGMGKPIGLGQINIEPIGIFGINRQQRYTFDGFSAPRYSALWLAPSEDRSQWPGVYVHERTAEGCCVDKDRLVQDHRRDMDEDIRQALELLGDPKSLKAGVHSPLLEGCEFGTEDNTFRWFVANEHGSGSKTKENRNDPAQLYLEPLSKKSKKLPTLRVLPWAD